MKQPRTQRRRVPLSLIAALLVLLLPILSVPVPKLSHFSMEAAAAITENRIPLTMEEQAFVNEHPVLRVHNELGWAPFNFVEQGRPSGFSIDYMNLLAEKTGLRVEYVTGPVWDEFLRMIESRQLDVMLNIVKTRDRERYIRFTKEPYIETPRAIVVRKSEEDIRSFPDLSGRLVVVEKGFFYEKYLTEHHPEIRLLTAPDTEATLRAVANGDADATIGVVAVEQFLIRRHFFSNLKMIVDPTEVALRGFDQYIGVRKDWPLLVNILDKAMAAVSDEERVALSRKWISPDSEIAPGGPEQRRVYLEPREKEYLKNHPVLKVAFDVDWPPVEYLGSSGSMEGMAADYLDHMGRLLGVKFQPAEPRPWKEMIAAMNKGETDLFSAISPTPPRKEWMSFTRPYLSFPLVILTRKEVSYIGSLADIKDRSIAIVDGYASHDLMQQHHPELRLMPVADMEEGIMKVATGKAFAFVDSLAAISHVMTREGITDLKVSGETPYFYDITMSVRKDNLLLLGILDKALAAISVEERNAVNNKWNRITYEYSLNYALIWKIGVGVILLFSLVLFWNRRLHREIAERKRAEEAADTANQAKSRFLANMTHELRTPLNIIIGFTHLMGRNRSFPPEEKQHIDIIGRSGEHLLMLINDILDLSQIEAGKMRLNESRFDLHLMLDDFERMFEQKTRKKKLDLTFHITRDVPRFVEADPVKLRQVLINLIGNAVKYTDSGGITVTVHSRLSETELCLSGARKGHAASAARCLELVFEVKDTGIGIEPDDVELIFDPFMQSRGGQDAREGTGLGLAISRKFTRLMGGDISVESRIGSGSVFRFHIPAKESESLEDVPKHRHGNVTGIAPGHPTPRILIVDDIEENRSLLRKILGPAGFELRDAANGREAVDQWRTWQPHLIWMDIRMPVMEGLEATRMIRAEEKKEGREAASRTCIIALSAGVFGEKRRAALDAGCNAFERKPLKQEIVLETIRRYLDIQYIYRDARQDSEDDGTPAASRISPADLENLPPDLHDALEKGARQADFLLLSDTIGGIRERNPELADALLSLTEAYQYDEILHLFQNEAASGDPAL